MKKSFITLATGLVLAPEGNHGHGDEGGAAHGCRPHPPGANVIKLFPAASYAFS
jgi:hypothetical protein